jgi:DNA-binding MarR family transcriptional regulator
LSLINFKNYTLSITNTIADKKTMDKKTEDKITKVRLSKKKDTEINLAILFDHAFSLMTNAIDMELKQFNTNQSQIRVLSMLSRENRPVTIDELSNWCLKGFNSVSTLINRMEQKGLVKKTKKNGDLKTYITLTDKGSILYHLQVTEHSIHLIVNKLSPVEKQQFEVILKKIRDNSRDILGLDFKPPFLS